MSINSDWRAKCAVSDVVMPNMSNSQNKKRSIITLVTILPIILHPTLGEVFVLDDGGEVDLDLGNYERFLNVRLTRDNNITTGKMFQHVSFLTFFKSSSSVVLVVRDQGRS